jgi:hypothetical protein
VIKVLPKWFVILWESKSEDECKQNRERREDEKWATSVFRKCVPLEYEKGLDTQVISRTEAGGMI